MTTLETKYLEAIQPYIAPAKAGDPAAVKALEQADEQFWQAHDPETYQLIQQVKV